MKPEAKIIPPEPQEDVVQITLSRRDAAIIKGIIGSIFDNPLPDLYYALDRAGVRTVALPRFVSFRSGTAVDAKFDFEEN